MTQKSVTLNGTTSELMGRLVLTRAQVAELFGVNENCISYLHRLGRLQGVAVGKELRWRPSDVRAFVESLEPTK